jgi:hypothetical protein
MAAGKTISIGGAGFNTGYLYIQGLTQNGNAAINLITTGTSSIFVGQGAAADPCTIGGILNITAPDISLRGGTFNGAVTVTKTGGGSNHNNQQQNIFNSTVTINQQSNGGYFMLGYNSNDLFNDNITVTSTGSGGIYLGWTSGTGTPTLAAGKTIAVGGSGFSSGFLSLNAFTQLGNAAMNLTFTGSNTSLTFAGSTVIGGNLTTNTPDVFFNGATFTGTVNATKTGAGNDAGSGGNTFQSTTTFANTGTGYLMFGNGTADTWNGDVNFNNSGAERILPCWNSSGNQFNGNIILSNTGSAVGIEFCGGNTTSSCTLTATKNIQIGTGGYNTGYLHLYRFTQLGTASSNLTFTGAATVIVVGPASAIGGNFTVVSPRILLNGVVYADTVNLTKTGATGEWSGGGNTFNSLTTINQLGSGYFGFANGSPDIYNGDVYVNNNSTERVIFGNSSLGNQFNGNVILTQIGYSVGIAFGWNNTTGITMAAGKTISIGAAGFNTGYLQIERFTQLGSAAMNLPLTGTSALTFGPTAIIGGNVVSTSASLLFNGCTFNGTLNATKNGASGDASSGGNIFQGTSSFTNSGSGYLLFGNGTADTWNADVTFTDIGSERILPCWNSSGNQFNGNIIFNSTGSSIGINFCGGTATSSATQAAGFGLSIGSSGFSAGYLILQRFTQLGNAATNLTLTATANYLQFGPSSSLGGNVTSSGPGLYFNGCTFGGTVNCTKTGASNDGGVGNNIFNGVTTITNAGSGYLQMGNGNFDQFNTTATFNNTGSGTMYIADNSANNIFGGDVTFNNTPTANTLINVSRLSAGTVFNGNIMVTSNNGQGVQFCSGNATATATLSTAKTITIGAGGFSTGTLLLKQFTQTGATPQSLTLTGSANLTFGPTSVFGGNVTCVSPTLFFNGCTYNGTLNATKNGSTNDQSAGNNIFNGAATMTNSGSGYLLLGNGNADQFNAASTFNNTGSSNIYVAYNSANNIFGGTATFNNTSTTNSPIYVSWLSGGTTFNGNIVVTSTNGGVQFCGGNTTATAILSAGNTIIVGAGGFSVGTLLLRQFTQVGATPQSLTLTGTGNLTFGPTSAFGGNVTCTSPTLLFNGCTFSGTTNCTKNGTTNDAGAGSNIFTGVSTINNSGAGYLMFGNGGLDQWITDVTFNNTGSNIIYAAYNSTGNSFGGNVICNNVGSTGNNSGIYFCAANNSSASVTGNLTVNNNSTSGTNNGIRFCEGNNTSFSVGGTTNITNTSTNTSNYIRFSNGTGSSTTFSGDVTVTNNGTVASTNIVHFGYTGSGIFNGNITLNSTGGAGIAFGANAGTSTQVNNKSINTSTFTGGPLYIRNFSQSGPATGNISNVSITGTNMLLTLNNSLFYDNVIGSSQEITASGSTFNGTTSLTKAGGNANDYFPGGNIFNGATTITNQSTFILGMANTTADAYNGNVTFVQNNTGALRPGYNANCTYAANITVTSPAATAITFGAGGASGISTMNGSSAQSINITTGAVPIFTQLVMNHTGSGVTLNTRINITSSLTMSVGIINTTSVNIVNMNNASTANIGNSSSYINGPMNYDMAFAGTRTLNFPIGKVADWRPAILGLNHSVATAYTYNSEVFDAPAPTNFTFPATIDTVSGVHYWVINRYTTGTTTSIPATGLNGNQTITLYFDVNDKVYDGAHLTIVKNTSAAPTAWIDIGGTGGPAALGGIALAGSVTSTSSPSAFNSFSTFTLGSKIGVWNPLPIEILYFTAKPAEARVELDWATATEVNNNYFTIEKSKDGVNFEFMQKVNSEALNGNSSAVLHYKIYDLTPYDGINYYRLKQTDFNGNYKYTSIAQVTFDIKSFVSVFPNPASNNIFINVSADYDNADLKITDAIGREVLSQKVNASNVNSVSTNSLIPGMYYVTIESQAGVINKTKIIIQK